MVEGLIWLFLLAFGRTPPVASVDTIRHVNVLELGPGGAGIGRVATLVLETFRLLRRERRLFISYRRVDAQPLAERLYDALDARGFDVFIDVRSVPPAVDFQSELWHRMSDSDWAFRLVQERGNRHKQEAISESQTCGATVCGEGISGQGS
jgi:hypothetical protein